MKKITTLLVSTALLVNAYATPALSQGVKNAVFTGANYTNNYIDFTLMSPSGKNLGIGGSVGPFSKGGTGDIKCCVPVSGVGQSLRVEMIVRGLDNRADLYNTYSRDVVVKGTTSNDPELMNYMVIRFFPDHNVEAEFITEPLKSGAPASPRLDKVFSGQRVMRHLGE